MGIASHSTAGMIPLRDDDGDQVSIVGRGRLYDHYDQQLLVSLISLHMALIPGVFEGETSRVEHHDIGSSNSAIHDDSDEVRLPRGYILIVICH